MTRLKHLIKEAKRGESYVTEEPSAILKLQCACCGSSLQMRERGRRRRFCSDACRQAHRKIAVTPENGLRYRTGRERPKSASQDVEVAADSKPENLSPKTDLALRCEKINDVTFKITNGELTNVPASHGQWGGYRTAKALAWILRLGPDAWIARCGNQICNPTWFKKAKAQALAMAKGAIGDYSVTNPARELNQLQTCFIETDEDSTSGDRE